MKNNIVCKNLFLFVLFAKQRLKKFAMSSNYRTEETPIYFDFKNSAYYNVEEVFTDLQSCELSNDTDSRKNINL